MFAFGKGEATSIEKYDGSSNPKAHVKVYLIHTNLFLRTWGYIVGFSRLLSRE